MPSARKRLKHGEHTTGPADIASKVVKPIKRWGKGKLAALTQMPLDILYEIFSYLNLPDVLKLSRTSKDFRRVLMSRSCVSVWKNARENVGLPECPPGMIEPQWANLAFSPHCHYCFTNGIRTVEWRFRMRICSRCAKEYLLETQYMLSVDGVSSKCLVPYRTASKRWKFVCVRAEWETVQLEISTLKGEELDAFIMQRSNQVVEILRHAEKCEEWALDQNTDRALERERLREARKNAIVEKLIALGWERDLQSIRRPDSLADHKLVKVPQRLTERIWINIQGSILQFMAEMRKKRIEREQKEIFMRRKRVAMGILQEYKNARLPYREVMPEAVDFCNMLPVKTIIDQALDVSVNATSFSHLIPQFPQLFESWRNEIRLQLSQVLKTGNEPLFFFDDDSDFSSSEFGLAKIAETDHEALEMLDLASTVFVCKECGPSLFAFLDMSLDRPIFYPEVLGHTCLTRKYSTSILPPDPTDPSLELNSTSFKRASWNTRPLMLSGRLRRIAEELINDSGLDSQVAKTTDMDELNYFYACLPCAELHSSGRPMAPVYRWRDAICHQAATHDMFEAEWYVASEAEFNENRVESDAEDEDGLSYEDGEEAMFPIWCCTRCRDTPLERGPMSLPSLSDHFLFQHEFYGNLVLDQDYFRSFDAHKREYASYPPKMFILSV